LGTAIHGKSFSGGASNRFQKLMHVVNLLSVQRSKVGIYHTDSSKPGGASRCGVGHTCLNRSNDETCAQSTSQDCRILTAGSWVEMSGVGRPVDQRIGVVHFSVEKIT
jgi:hypothetical protein